MAKTNHWGALAAAAGTLVAGGLLVLMLLVGVEPAGAAFPGQNGEIAYVHDDGNDWEIYSVNANGTDVVRLTDNNARDMGPAWSPDARIPGGNQIAFWSNRDGDLGEIYTMNPSLAILGPHGLIINLTTDRLTNSSAWDSDPAWSPDGKKIAFTSTREGGNHEIYTMNANGTDVVRLTYNPQGDYQPAWSPDGKKIAFMSTREGDGAERQEIYTMNSSGTDSNGTDEPFRLTYNNQIDSEPDWQPFRETPVLPHRQLQP